MVSIQELMDLVQVCLDQSRTNESGNEITPDTILSDSSAFDIESDLLGEIITWCGVVPPRDPASGLATGRTIRILQEEILNSLNEDAAALGIDTDLTPAQSLLVSDRVSEVINEWFGKRRADEYIRNY